MGKIHYIGWYIGEKEVNRYSGNVPAALKMHYMASKLSATGKQVFIYSMARRINTGLYRRHESSEKDFPIVYSSGYSSDNKFLKRLNAFIQKWDFIYYILFSVKPEDTIVLYHSVSYTHYLSILRKWFRRHVILEVEEIYGYAAQGDNEHSLKLEFRSIPKMDEFVLINDYLRDEFNLPKEKCVPCYGVVNIPDRTADRFNDGKIHVVYAGTIEGRKQGAFLAVETAEYLPNNYMIHVLGFGKEEHISYLKNRVKEINEKKGHEVVVYHGFMSGRELDEFLFKCHIGISTYVQRDVFANNSLPSKILTYMCHDLAVVRGTASAFKMMDISKFWTLYSNGTPEDVAKAIIHARVPEIGENTQYLLSCDKRVEQFLKRYC